MKKTLAKGLFNRLVARGVHPTVAGEIAVANYPHRAGEPSRVPTVDTRAVNYFTEQFLDRGTIFRFRNCSRACGA